MREKVRLVCELLTVRIPRRAYSEADGHRFDGVPQL